MSVFICADCTTQIDSDIQDIFLDDGEDICEDCWEKRNEDKQEQVWNG